MGSRSTGRKIRQPVATGRSYKASLLASTASATSLFVLFNMYALRASMQDLWAPNLGALLTDTEDKLVKFG